MKANQNATAVLGEKEKALRKAISNMLFELRKPMVPPEYFPAYDWLRVAFDEYKCAPITAAAAQADTLSDEAVKLIHDWRKLSVTCDTSSRTQLQACAAELEVALRASQKPQT